MSRVYTGKGDDGSTGLLFGGRVPEGPPAARGLRHRRRGPGRHRAGPGRDRAGRRARPGCSSTVEHDLYVLMAELATQPENRPSSSTARPRSARRWSTALSERTDDAGRPLRVPHRVRRAGPGASCPPASTWPAPSCAGPSGGSLPAAAEGSHVVPYLNRLSSLLWTAARWVEADDTLLSQVDPETVHDRRARTLDSRRRRRAPSAPPASPPTTSRRTRCRSSSTAQGFTAEVGQTQVVPDADGRPTILVGLGADADRTVDDLRHGRRRHRPGRPQAPGGDHRRARRPSASSTRSRPPRRWPRASASGSTRYTVLQERPEAVAARGACTSSARAASGCRTRSTSAPPIADAVAVARDLVNEPGGTLTPPAFARRGRVARRELRLRGHRARQARDRGRGMGGLLGVNRGSEIEPRFLELRWVARGQGPRRRGPRGQGHHVRLGRAQHQAERGHAHR